MCLVKIIWPFLFFWFKKPQSQMCYKNTAASVGVCVPKLAQICIFVLENNCTQTDINIPPNKATFLPSNIITEVPAIRRIRIKK